MKQAEVARVAAELGVSLTPVQLDQLDIYASLLLSRGIPLGVVAEGDRDRLWERHILDSLRCAPVVGEAGSALDLGSGGGLPGVPLAIACPDLDVVLVERRRGRAAFLELVVSEVGLPRVQVALAGTEEITGPADLCTARAFSSPERSWEAARGLLRHGGRLVYFGGKGFEGVGELPELSRCDLLGGAVLESSGPLVIMTRK